MQEEQLMNVNKKLELQKENESKINIEVFELKQTIEICNNTINNLHDESKTNSILIPELQNKIDVSI